VSDTIIEHNGAKFRILDVQQGSPEWQMARLGIPTASKFDNLMTPKTMKPSASAEKYAWALIAEQLLGVPTEGGSSGYTQRGQAIEERARSFYELKRDVDVVQVGFVLRADGRAGCSPDGFIGDDGILEIKCPKPENHIGYMLDAEGIGYRCQVQGMLMLTGRKWVDTISYHPDLPPALVRVARDETFISALDFALRTFLQTMDGMKASLIEAGHFEKGAFGSLPMLRATA
jgi:hypothetical protein